MYDHQLIFTVVSFECGFIRGKNCQTMFIMPSSDVFHQWGDMIINYGTDNESPDFETMIFHIGLAQNYIVAPWLVAQNYTPKWAGCLLSLLRKCRVTIRAFQDFQARNHQEHLSGLLTMVSNFTRVVTIIGEAFQRISMIRPNFCTNPAISFWTQSN